MYKPSVSRILTCTNHLCLGYLHVQNICGKDTYMYKPSVSRLSSNNLCPRNLQTIWIQTICIYKTICIQDIFRQSGTRTPLQTIPTIQHARIPCVRINLPICLPLYRWWRWRTYVHTLRNFDFFLTDTFWKVFSITVLTKWCKEKTIKWNKLQMADLVFVRVWNLSGLHLSVFSVVGCTACTVLVCLLWPCSQRYSLPMCTYLHSANLVLSLLSMDMCMFRLAWCMHKDPYQALLYVCAHFCFFKPDFMVTLC